MKNSFLAAGHDVAVHQMHTGGYRGSRSGHIRYGAPPPNSTGYLPTSSWSQLYRQSYLSIEPEKSPYRLRFSLILYTRLATIRPPTKPIALQARLTEFRFDKCRYIVTHLPTAGGHSFEDFGNGPQSNYQPRSHRPCQHHSNILV